MCDHNHCAGLARVDASVAAQTKLLAEVRSDVKRLLRDRDRMIGVYLAITAMASAVASIAAIVIPRVLGR